MASRWRRDRSEAPRPSAPGGIGSYRFLHRVLCRQLKEMQRGDPATGTGKPEPLRHALAGLWSRRLSLKDRLVYRDDDKSLYVMAIGGHYDS